MKENRFDAELVQEAAPEKPEREEMPAENEGASAVAIAETEVEEAEDNQRESISHNQATPEEHDPISSVVNAQSDYQRMSSLTHDNTSAAAESSEDESSSNRSTLNSRQSMLTIDEESRQVLANAMVHFVNRVPAPKNRSNLALNSPENSSNAVHLNANLLSDPNCENSSGSSRTPSPGLASDEEGVLTPTSSHFSDNESLNSATKRSMLISNLIHGNYSNTKGSSDDRSVQNGFDPLHGLDAENQDHTQRNPFNLNSSSKAGFFDQQFSSEERRGRISGHLLGFAGSKRMLGEDEEMFVEEEEIVLEKTSDCFFSAPAAELSTPSQVIVFFPLVFSINLK